MPRKIAMILSEREDCEFKQLILLIQNLVWLLLEYLYLEWETPTKFRIIRCIYFGFLGTTRIDLFDHPETDDFFWPKLWKTFKVWCTDFFSMCCLIWMFGRSFLYPVSILETAFCLSMMFLPERIF